MKETRVASRYAHSLLDLAIEQNALEKVREDAKQILSVVNENRDLRAMLESPVIPGDKKSAVLKEIFKGVSPLMISFLSLLTKHSRENSLDQILTVFVTQYNEHKGVQKAIVTSAVGLDEKLRKEVLEIVKKQTSSEVELVEKIDKSLIGGFTLKFGDRQIDSSIARSLRNLKRTLGENPNQ